MERARELLETTDLPVERIAGLRGFGTAVSMRPHFRQRLGTSPAVDRKAFREAANDAAITWPDGRGSGEARDDALVICVLSGKAEKNAEPDNALLAEAAQAVVGALRTS